MENIVLLILALSGLGVLFTFAEFVMYHGTKKQPSPKVVMASIGIFAMCIVLLFII